MARLLFAWELGSNFGHVSRMLPVALALRARGHEIVFALREPPRGAVVLKPHGFAMLQAPVWLGRTGPQVAAPNFAGMLQRCGYDSATSLSGLIAGWSRLYALTRPDLVLLDHAPTAALAARLARIPCVRLGSGWFAPPDVTPLPLTEPWRRIDPAVPAAAEAQVLAAINGVMAAAGRPPLHRVTQIFALEADVLTTFPELDHYGARPGLRYWGPTGLPVASAPPSWPAGDGPRVFGFVDAAYAGFDALLQQLPTLGFPVLVYARDLPEAKARLLSTGSVRVVTQPVDLARTVREAALVLCHAGHGTVCEALLAGVPLLLLPRQSEQRWLCDRVRALGAAQMLIAAKGRSPDFAAAIRDMLARPAYAEAAGRFARRHAGHDPRMAAAAIADICESILRRPVTAAAASAATGS